MGFEEHAKLIISVVSNTESLKSMGAELKQFGKEARRAGVQLASAGAIMRNKGISSAQIRTGLRRFTKALKTNNIAVHDSGRYIDNFSGKVLSSSRIASIATRSLRKQGTTFRDMSNDAAKADMAFKRVAESMRRMGKGSFEIKSSIANFKDEMGNLNLAINKNGQFFDKTSNKVQSFGRVAGQVSRYSMRQFRGEFLSLMFLGQGMAQTFQRLMDPVFQVAGVFDVWRATLITVMGPLLIPFSMILIDIMKGLMGLSPETKKSLAAFVLLGFAIAKLVALVAPLGILLYTLGGWSAVGPVLKTIVGTAGGLWGILGNVAGIFAILSGVMSVFVGVIEKRVWPVLKGLALILAGVLFIIGGWIPVVIGLAIVAIVALANKFGYVKAVVMAILSPLANLWDLLAGIVGTIGKLFGMTDKGWGEVWDMSASKKTYGEIGNSWSAGWGNVPKLAKGGIVSKPTLAMIGEAGPEAVVPLSRGGGAGAGMVLNYNPTLNINTSAGMSGGEIDNIVRMVNSKLYDDLRRLGIR